MPRVRLGVVLLVPSPVAEEVDGLRRACDDPVLDQVAPHVTLVPPVNVRQADVPAALAVLRRAAAGSRPLALRLGPVTTFATVERVAYLAVDGAEPDPEAGLAALQRLRDAVFVAPLARPLDHPFVPHVTIGQGLTPERLAAVLAATTGFSGRPVTFDAVQLLQEGHGRQGRRWTPVAEVALGPAVVVGRGGLEVELTSSTVIDLEAVSLASGAACDPAGTRPLVTVARREGAVVGLARGWTAGPVAELVELVTADPDDGVAAHLEAAWWSAAAGRGADEPFRR